MIHLGEMSQNDQTKSLHACFLDLLGWLASSGIDQDDKVIMATDGSWNIGNLMPESELSSLAKSWSEWVNLRWLFADLTHQSPMPISGMLKHSGVPEFLPEAGSEDMCLARNLARLCTHFSVIGCNLAINDGLAIKTRSYRPRELIPSGLTHEQLQKRQMVMTSQEAPLYKTIGREYVEYYCVIEVAKTAFACPQCTKRKESGFSAIPACKQCKVKSQERRKFSVPIEIIELAAVLVGLDGSILARSPRAIHLIQPTSLPLSPYCTMVTNLTSADLRPAPNILHGLANHTRWLKETVSDLNRVVYVTAGDFTLFNLLPVQCKHSNFTVPLPFMRWVNVKKVYESLMQEKATSVRDISRRLGLPPPTSESTIDSCNGIVAIMRHMLARDRHSVNNHVVYGNINACLLGAPANY